MAANPSNRTTIHMTPSRAVRPWLSELVAGTLGRMGNGSSPGDVSSPELGASDATYFSGGEEPLPLGRALLALGSCAWRSARLVATRRIRQPDANVGQRMGFADGTSAVVYRETVIEREPPTDPAVLVVCFRLRRVRRAWMHALFRLESELNTVLFAGFPGLVSKLWLGHDQNGVYRGFYQWDGPDLALSYVRALRWALALVSEPGTIHYAVLPGLDRDEIRAEPSLIDRVCARSDDWWRPVAGLPCETRPCRTLRTIDP
jgi:hypothetical protein